MIRFLLKLGLFFPVLLGMAWVNWSVDPAMLFGNHEMEPSRHEYEARIAQDLLAGRPHPYYEPYSEWIVDDLVFRGRPQIDAFVFGSSVAKSIQRGHFGGPSFYNASFLAGGVQEMVALYQLALDCGHHPRRVLLEVDYLTLARRSPSGLPLLAKARKRFGLPDEAGRPAVWPAIWHALVPTGEVSEPAEEHGPFYPYDTLFSPRYLQLSLEFLVRFRATDDRMRAGSGNAEFLDHVVYPDGSLQWSREFRDVTPQSIRLKFDLPRIVSLINAGRRDPAECHLLESFVAELVESGVDVEFLLMPLNPWVYDEGEKEWKRTGKPLPSIETEAYIRSLAGRYKLRVRGSLNPHRLGVREEDYIDGTHMRREVVDRLCKQLNLMEPGRHNGHEARQ